MQLFERKLGKRQKAALKALAEGIECGAALRPQGIEQLFTPIWKSEFHDGEPKEYASCALGAAWECHLLKIGKPIDFRCDVGIGKVDYEDIMKAYGVNINHNTVLVEIDGRYVESEPNLVEFIWHLNDFCKFTRERIAQILREVE